MKRENAPREWIDINTGVFLREMCSVRCKNHVFRQKIPEGTSSAMFDVRTFAKCCEFKRCTSTRFNVTRVTQVTVFVTINTGVFLGKMCSERRKNRKKTRRHQLCYIWDRDRCEILRTQALRRPRSQHGTGNKDEVFKSNLNFLLSLKDNWVLCWTLSFHL